MKGKHIAGVVGLVVWMFLGVAWSPPPASAHCDTLDGPVVAAAKTALAKGDATPVLKWVRPGDESAIKEAFKKTLAVRAKGSEARELADHYFFETLVRLHRAGEGAPFTGLKAGPVEPAVAVADKALDSGKGDHLAHEIGEAVAQGIGQRFAQTYEAKKHAEESVEAGRKFVAAYVEFTHYVEKLDMMASGGGHHAEQPEQGAKKEHRH
ncbi:MAG: hypothetical protein HY794_02330 [Desulfarculus sp.]|nr:hypothetical protein [Desulfarculus sp.]